MATTTKSPVKKSKKAPPAGRKMNRKQAREYVFKTYGKAMELLAKN
jgi:hypothetical protein